VDRGLARRFASFYFLLLLPVGMQAPYLFLFFRRQGFSDTQLGTLAAVTPIVTALSPPLWGALADRFGDRRRTLALLLAGSAVVFPWLMLARQFPVALGLMIVFSLFATTPGAIADAITLEHVERTGHDYGRLRLWGSVGFATPLLVLGLVLERSAGGSARALYPVFIGYAVFRLIGVAWTRLLPPSRGAVGARVDWSAARAFASRAFLGLALCAVVGGGAMSGYYVYFSIYLDQIGLADNLKGYFWAVAVGAETAMMFGVGGLIRRIGLKWTFALSLLGVTLRLLAFSFRLGPLQIAVVQCLHALTFTTFTVSSITFVSRLAPPHLRASGQTLWLALTGGLGSAVGSKLAGVAAQAYGLQAMYRLFSLAAGVAMLGAVALVREPAPALTVAPAAGVSRGRDQELPAEEIGSTGGISPSASGDGDER
jgi:PPP family 3-phenylpropionic acid transporter